MSKRSKPGPYEARKSSIAECAIRLQSHMVRERISRSWTLHAVRPDGSYDSNLAYSVTWTPGTIVLAGDIGELTITHYNAAATLEGAVTWLHGAGFDYLMSKSDAKEVFDKEATLAFIVEMANDEAIHSMRAEWGEMRRHRAGEVEEKKTADEAGESFTPEPYETTLKITSRYDGAIYGKRSGEIKLHSKLWTVPDGWERWFRIWAEIDGYDDADMIFTAKGRRELKDALESRLSDCGGERATELCRELGFDDYYGSETYPHRCEIQYAALQRWAAHVVNNELQKVAA